MRKALCFGITCLFVGCASSDPAPVSGPDASTTAPPPPPAPPPATPGDMDAGNACLAVGADCKAKPDSCCNGSTCVYDVKDPSKSLCASTCLSNNQCNSGCCTKLVQGNAAVCAPVEYCSTTCAQPGASCAANACCPNSVCVESTVTGVSCAARCTAGAQCVSGCCAPLNNTGETVCSPASFCH